jgi:hypothetical protein
MWCSIALVHPVVRQRLVFRREEIWRQHFPQTHHRSVAGARGCKNCAAGRRIDGAYDSDYRRLRNHLVDCTPKHAASLDHRRRAVTDFRVHVVEAIWDGWAQIRGTTGIQATCNYGGSREARSRSLQVPSSGYRPRRGWLRRTLLSHHGNFPIKGKLRAVAICCAVAKVRRGPVR